MSDLAALQRESARVNELQGVLACVVGTLHEIMRAQSLEDAKTFAEMLTACIAEFHADLWKPGPHDDPADWNKR